jgi:hypothetical protein
MRVRFGGARLLTAAVAMAAVFGSYVPAFGQGVPRTADGKPNFSGIWQAANSANWNIQTHEASSGPVVALGAAFAVPGGLGVVEGNEIPYQPGAAEKKRQNGENWMELDPEVKCFMPGIPRATYMPFPFQIVQSPDTIIMAYEYASASRVIRMNSKEKSPAPAWMGWNIAHWEDDTLVIDVTDNMPDTWFDRAGNYHSEDLHVVERFSVIDANTLNYEATIEDPKVFTRPWKMSMPLYRRIERNARILEYECYALDNPYNFISEALREQQGQ